MGLHGVLVAHKPRHGLPVTERGTIAILHACRQQKEAASEVGQVSAASAFGRGSLQFVALACRYKPTRLQYLSGPLPPLEQLRPHHVGRADDMTLVAIENMFQVMMKACMCYEQKVCMVAAVSGEVQVHSLDSPASTHPARTTRHVHAPSWGPAPYTCSAQSSYTIGIHGGSTPGSTGGSPLFARYSWLSAQAQDQQTSARLCLSPAQLSMECAAPNVMFKANA